MQLQSIHPEDIVEVDRRGYRFLARVKRIDNGVLRIQPIDNRISTFHASARQIVGVWHANARTRRRLAEDPLEDPIGVAE